MTDMPRKATILMGCDTFMPDVNGAARFTERLCAGLIKRGLNVQVLAPAPSKKEAGTRVERVEGVDIVVHRLPSHKLWGHEWIRFVMPWIARKYAKRLIEQVAPDAVHIQSHILIGRGLAAEAQKAGVRIIATNHVMPENIVDMNRMPKIIQKPFLKVAWADVYRVIRKAENVTTPTRKAADFLEKNSARRGVIPISCGLDASDYTPSFEPRKSNRIVFVGRLNLEKQIDVAIEALAKCDTQLGIQFDIVGGGDQRANLEKLAVRLGVADSVHWHGKTTDQELRNILTNGSIFVMPSIAELQSIATLEAMASGLPIIVANAMALPHLVEVGRNGYMFEPGNSSELSGRIEQILRLTGSEYLAMQKASLEMVANHDIERTLNAFEALYAGRKP